MRTKIFESLNKKLSFSQKKHFLITGCFSFMNDLFLWRNSWQSEYLTCLLGNILVYHCFFLWVLDSADYLLQKTLSSLETDETIPVHLVNRNVFNQHIDIADRTFHIQFDFCIGEHDLEKISSVSSLSWSSSPAAVLYFNFKISTVFFHVEDSGRDTW